ncbi:extracellular solute-binding protein family 3 [Kribbella flavida DSM 17836]|uniref:Extracellular solute-binding protein family 3 n=1 Tax=Kribbella flavida (strain DSM 17836 / JCM 10339 / NBRC 14399) TaxID=479435 RepID=D2PUV6_KRIFD|nr:transporter substrate-binding domain-containing protein [Kribbella flavida]ADB31422.1 extracellular solute-binding protein family 3 [Kribbella flavida DSM 17836]
MTTVAGELAPGGVLRAAINLGNPVLAQGTPEAPRGVTVDIATEVARRLGAEVEFLCFGAARESFAALVEGRAELAFLAVEPARANEVVFTAPYVVIEGVYVVPEDSAIVAPEDVDRNGVRVGVKDGSAYDLFLTRTLQRASIVRGAEGVDVFLGQGLEAGAGIRRPVEEFVARMPGVRVVQQRFMEIRQAVATRKGRQAETVAFLATVVEELKASGFVAEALRRSGRLDASVAPPV